MSGTDISSKEWKRQTVPVKRFVKVRRKLFLTAGRSEINTDAEGRNLSVLDKIGTVYKETGGGEV